MAPSPSSRNAQTCGAYGHIGIVSSWFRVTFEQLDVVVVAAAVDKHAKICN